MAATDAWTGTRLAFRFLVLTATRNGEVRGATWDEMDVDGALWTIPAARMKAAVEHRVPLSDAALAVLDEGARDRRPERLGVPEHHRPADEQQHAQQAAARERRGRCPARIPVVVP